jgi:hypothetical protein
MTLTVLDYLKTERVETVDARPMYPFGVLKEKVYQIRDAAFLFMDVCYNQHRNTCNVKEKHMRTDTMIHWFNN